METFEEMIDRPSVGREEKLVAAYRDAPEKLSRGMHGVVSALCHAPPAMVGQMLAGSSDDERIVSIARLNDAVEKHGLRELS